MRIKQHVIHDDLLHDTIGNAIIGWVTFDKWDINRIAQVINIGSTMKYKYNVQIQDWNTIRNLKYNQKFEIPSKFKNTDNLEIQIWRKVVF